MILFAHSYCSYKDGTRLTAMTEQSVRAIVPLYKSGMVHRIVLATAYEDVWWDEAQLKKDLLEDLGVDLKHVDIIEEVKDSFDEVNAIKEILDRIGEKELMVVAEKYHAPRSNDTFRALLPGVRVEMVTFVTPYFERPLEPHPIKLFGLLKEFRASYKFTWILWNKVFRVLGKVKMVLDRRKSRK